MDLRKKYQWTKGKNMAAWKEARVTAFETDVEKIFFSLTLIEFGKLGNNLHCLFQIVQLPVINPAQNGESVIPNGVVDAIL